MDNHMSEAGIPLIEIENMTKVFYTDEVETHALAGVHLMVRKGEYVAMSGPSGPWPHVPPPWPLANRNHLITAIRAACRAERRAPESVTNRGETGTPGLLGLAG